MSLLFLLAGCAGPDDSPADCDVVWFLDEDGDGYGGDVTSSECDAPPGYVADATDCDDADGSSYPGAAELCDGVDNDCDGSADEDAGDAIAAFADADGDGFGDDDSPTTVCALGEGVSEVGGDCDDGDPAVFPDAPELCDGLDNDCDGATDGLAVPGDFATISEAVDAASDGDLICLAAGDHTEAVLLDKSVRLGGEGAETTRLSSPDVDVHALAIAADDVQVRDLSIGGVSVAESSGAVLSDLEISGTDCGATTCEGSALHIRDSEAELLDVHVVDNRIEATYGGTFRVSGFAYLSDSDVRWVGGGVVQNEVSAVVPKLTYGYGLLHISGGTLYGQDLDISENIVGAFNTYPSGANINFNGLLYISQADVELLDTRLADNDLDAWAFVGDGGTGTSNAQSNGWFHATSDSTLTWTGGGITNNLNTNRADNTAYSWGAYVGGPLTMTDVDIHGNVVTASTNLDGYQQCQGMYGYGASWEWTRVDVRDNRVDCDSPSGFNMGLVYLGASDATLSNVVLAGNEVSSGGGMYGLLTFYRPTSTPVITNATVVGNTLQAYKAGSGVFYVDGSGIEVRNAAVTNNWVTVDTYDNYDYAAPAVLGINSAWPYTFEYSLLWGNGSSSGREAWAGNEQTLTGANEVFTADPAYTSVATATADGWELQPGDGSPLIDAGSPDIEDADGSLSDIGAYGGPEAW